MNMTAPAASIYASALIVVTFIIDIISFRITNLS